MRTHFSFSFVVQSVRLWSWKWAWLEHNEWNAQHAAGGVYHMSLRLQDLEFLEQLFQTPDTTHLEVFLSEMIHKLFQIHIFLLIRQECFT